MRPHYLKKRHVFNHNFQVIKKLGTAKITTKIDKYNVAVRGIYAQH